MYLPLIDVVDRVAVSVVNCPTPLIERAILDAAREFCRDTDVHVEPSGMRQVSPSILKYEFDAGDPNLECVKIKNVTQQGEIVRNALILRNPLSEGFIRADMVLAPSYRTRRLWAPLVTEYYEALESGALAKLYRQNGAAYFSPELALQERSRFHDAIHNAATASKKPTRVRMIGNRWT